MANTQLLKLRLFLEGTEVPVIGASITSAIGSPSQANIEVIGDRTVLEFPPRTMVHLFVYDPRAKSKVSPKDPDGKYTLLFCGDLMSVSYNKTGATRNATLSCLDDSSYHDLAYTYFFSNRSLVRGTVPDLTQERAYFVGASTGMAGVTGAGDLISHILDKVFRDPTPKTFGFSTLKGLTGAVIRLIEKFTGVTDLKRGGVNQFFSFHSRRKRLLSQIYVSEADNLAHHLLSSKFIIDFINKKTTTLGELITLRQLLKYILDFIYYRIVPNSSPMYVPEGQRVVKYVDNPALTALIHRVQARLLIDKDSGGVSLTVVSSDIDSISTESDPDIIALKTVAKDAEEGVKTSIEKGLAAAMKGDAADAYLSLSGGIIQGSKTRLKESSAERLYTMNILPDLYFGVAPSCNVLYPDMYISLNYSRALSSEATRLHLTTNIERSMFETSGVDQLIYYAPSIEEFTEIQSRTVKGVQADRSRSSQTAIEHAQDIISGKIFDHEIFSGVIPSFSTVDRLAHTIAMVKANSTSTLGSEVQESVQQLRNSMQDQSGFSNLERDDFFIRIANAQFVRAKLGNRRASVVGVLNPYAAVGLPMVILDGTPVTGKGDLFEDPRSATSQNEHYVGLLTSITHSVSQQSAGTTSYELKYVRPHRAEDDAFLSKLSSSGVINTAGSAPVTVRFSDLKNAGTGITDTQIRDFAVLLGCTKRAGGDFTSKVKTTSGQEITVPNIAGKYTPGVKVLDENIRAIDVLSQGGHAGGDTKDILVNTFEEQTSFISKFGAAAYIEEIKRALATNQLPALGRETQSIMIDLLDGVREIEPTPEVIRACAEYANKVPSRFPIPAFSEINVYYGDAPRSSATKAPLEEMIRPRYVDDIYSSALISEKLYMPMLGVRAITDVVRPQVEALDLPQFEISTSPGRVTLSTSPSTVKVPSQESAIDILAYEYGSNGSAGGEFSMKKVYRDIATLPDVLGSFHFRAWATSNEDKPIALVDDSVYDQDKDRCPDGFRPATEEEVIEINKRINPRLDVRAARNEIVRKYRNRLKSRGMLG